MGKKIKAISLLYSMFLSSVSPISALAYETNIKSSMSEIHRDTRLKGFGGTGSDNLTGITHTSDGGSIIVGSSSSSDLITNSGATDAIIMKVNSLGEVEWQRSFGGSLDDGFQSVVQLPTGEYIAVGYSSSTDAGFVNNGAMDAILVKYSKTGQQLFVKSIGGSSVDSFTSITNLNNGDIIITGYYESNDNGFSNSGWKDSFITRYDINGNQKWIEYLNGAGDDIYCSVVQLLDGNIVVSGYSFSHDIFIQNLKGTDGILVKYDLNGNRIWGKRLGGDKEDYLYSLIKTSDGGFITVGETNASTASLPIEPKGDNDAIIIKYNTNGNLQWINNFGGAEREGFFSVIETTDNKFMAVGRSASTNAGFENKGNNDAIIVQYDKDGTLEWSTSFGGTYNEYFNAVTRTIDGGFVAVGYTYSGDIGFAHNGDMDGMIANNNPIIDVVNDSLKDKNSINEIQDVDNLMNQISQLPDLGVKDELQTEVLEILMQKVEENSTTENISKARNVVNNMEESLIKDTYQSKLNDVTKLVDMAFEKKNVSANIDLYIKSENILIMSLNTNSITFEDFSGVEDMEKNGEVNITINSSLPYQLNAYLPTEIQNADKTNTMDLEMLNVKESSEADYKEFTNINEKLVLKDNNPAGNDLVHGIDLKLKGGIAHEKDVYKTTIKFEVEQK